MTTVAELPAGFADKVLSAQTTFRSVLDAMARPGQRSARRGRFRRAWRHDARHRRLALTLFDHDTPVWLDDALSETSDVAQMAQVSHRRAGDRAIPSISSFAVIGDARGLPALDRFALGTNEYPDRSTTLILQVESLTQGRGLSCAVPASTAPPCCAPTLPARGPVRTACRSITRCFRAASMSCWSATMPLSRCRAPRGLSRRETEACMSPSREANAPSRTPIGCWRMSGAAIATLPELSLEQISGQLSARRSIAS